MLIINLSRNKIQTTRRFHNTPNSKDFNINDNIPDEVLMKRRKPEASRAGSSNVKVAQVLQKSL